MWSRVRFPYRPPQLCRDTSVDSAMSRQPMRRLEPGPGRQKKCSSGGIGRRTCFKTRSFGSSSLPLSTRTVFSPGGGIGRHTGLRSQRLRACRFDAGLGHHFFFRFFEGSRCRHQNRSQASNSCFPRVCSSTRQSSGLQSRRLEVRFFSRPPAISGGVPQWSKGADCKSACVSTRQFESDHRLHLIAFSACSSARTERWASTPVCRPFESAQARHIPYSTNLKEICHDSQKHSGLQEDGQTNSHAPHPHCSCPAARHHRRRQRAASPRPAEAGASTR